MTDENTLEENIKARDIRLRGFEGVLREQFQLAYFGHISYDASETMTFQERRTMYKLLVEQKQEEKKQHEEAAKAAKARSSNRGRKSH